VRDLLRKRLQLVQHKSAHILSFKNLVSRNLGLQIPSNDIKKLREEAVEGMFKEEHLVRAGQANLATRHFLKERITALEKMVLKRAKLKGEYHNLLRVPGIGKILALTIMLERGAITRFPEVGNYV
jgi:transposase